MNYKNIIIILIVIIIIGALSFVYVSLNSHDLKLEMVSNSTLQNGDSVEVVLKDSYRNVYSGEDVEIKVLDDSGWPTKDIVVTDEDGIARMQLFSLENGNYTVHATYNGTLFNSPASSVNTLVIDDGY